MIVKEIESACQRQVIEDFDFYNDYYDTLSWLKDRGNTPVATTLSEAYDQWIEETRARDAEERNKKDRERIIYLADQRKEFVTEMDGFIYWLPSEESQGHLASHHLRWIADELDKRNEEWEKIIEDEPS